MITEKDITALSLHKTKRGRFGKWMIYSFPFLMVIFALLKLMRASYIGSKEGYSLSALFTSWIKGPEPQEMYSGIYLMAIDRFEGFMLYMIGAIIMAILAYGFRLKIHMHDRILGTLDSKAIDK